MPKPVEICLCVCLSGAWECVFKLIVLFLGWGWDLQDIRSDPGAVSGQGKACMGLTGKEVVPLLGVWFVSGV